MHNSLDASWICCTHWARVQSWSMCGLQVKFAYFHALALTCQARYACALLYLCPPFTEVFPHRAKGAHNLQPPIQSCLPKSFLGLDYDLLWEILSVNNTANRKREEWWHSLAKDLLVILKQRRKLTLGSWFIWLPGPVHNFLHLNKTQHCCNRGRANLHCTCSFN